MLQQSVEKYLKAALVQRDIIPDRTHSITALLQALEPSVSRSSREWLAARLFNVIFETRYPGDLPEPRNEEAQALREAAEVLRAFAREKLGLDDSK